MYALVDCNNFYVSCERVFQPRLRNRPVLVLSNNDGCVIARSNEVKKLGIGMGKPFFEVKDLIRRHNITVFSSNYTLYGDMSARVMSILSSFTPRMEIYSIDEAFLDLSGFGDLTAYGQRMVRAATQGTGIPTSVGIASTKTLAKIANRFAKKFPAYENVCLIDTDERRIHALQLTGIGDVWGIGRQHEKRLREMGIRTACDFSMLSPDLVRRCMTVVGLRIWEELNGSPCLELDLVSSPKKQICTSRSFGEMVDAFDDLGEAVASFASICAEKLRKQNSCAVSMMVFVHTNRFREDLPQHFRNRTITFPTPTDDTSEIIRYALEALRSVYAQGIRYKKAGVIITEVIAKHAVQYDMFDTVDREKRARIMSVIDTINASPGFVGNRVFLAAQGVGGKWKLRNRYVSRRYTTDPKDFITVEC